MRRNQPLFLKMSVGMGLAAAAVTAGVRAAPEPHRPEPVVTPPQGIPGLGGGRLGAAVTVGIPALARPAAARPGTVSDLLPGEHQADGPDPLPLPLVPDDDSADPPLFRRTAEQVQQRTPETATPDGTSSRSAPSTRVGTPGTTDGTATAGGSDRAAPASGVEAARTPGSSEAEDGSGPDTTSSTTAPSRAADQEPSAGSSGRDTRASRVRTARTHRATANPPTSEEGETAGRTGSSSADPVATVGGPEPDAPVSGTGTEGTVDPAADAGSSEPDASASRDGDTHARPSADPERDTPTRSETVRGERSSAWFTTGLRGRHADRAFQDEPNTLPPSGPSVLAFGQHRPGAGDDGDQDAEAERGGRHAADLSPSGGGRNASPGGGRHLAAA